MIGSPLHHLAHPSWKKLYLKIFGVPHLSSHIKAAAVSALLKNQHPIEVLDAGCGSGLYSVWLAQRLPGCTILGIDEAGQAFQQMSNLLALTGVKNLCFEQKDLRHLAYQKHFDLIVCLDVLEHVQEDGLVICRLRDALKTEGWMIIHVPRRHQEQFRAFGSWVQWTDHGHVRDEYTRDEIITIIQGAGLQILSFQTTFRPAQAPFWEISKKIPPDSGLNWLLFPFLLGASRLGGFLESENGNGFLIVCQRKG